MTTALDIIKKAMQKIGAITKNETPSSDEANDGLDALNGMLSSWSNDSTLTYARFWETFDLVSNQSTYTIGAGQDFDTARPILIADAYVTLGGSNVNYDVEVIPDESYVDIDLKTQPGIPCFLTYDNNFPYGKIRLWPVPMAPYKLFLLTEKELVQFTQLNQVVQLPPGWERALIYNLGLELSPEYGVEVPAITARIAQESKGAIQRSILKTRTLDAEPNDYMRRNILADRTR